MTSIAFTSPLGRVAAALPLSVAVALLSACGGGTTAEVPVVTVTPAATASSAPPTATATSTSPVADQVTAPKSDVVGRKFDLGTIVSVKDDGDVPVIIFDRWTARGVPDSTLAVQGMSLGVHADSPYQNLNSRITYRIPVAQGAMFTYRHCLAADQPPEQKSSTLRDFARLQNPEKVTLLTLDQHGRVFSAQNDPAC